MSKKFTIGLLVFFAGVAGNLVAGWLQQGKWAIQPTTEQFLGTLVGAGLILFIVALLESERALAWNWRWHRFWYLRELLKNPDLRHWETDFARLEMVQGRRRITGAEVIAEGRRQDMIEVLRELIVGHQEKAPRLLVFGEPGSGKTTGLERLTLDLARAGSRRLGIGCKMPVLLRLGNFQQGTLLDFATQKMEQATKRSSGEILSKGIKKLIKQGRVVLLCDALDEALGSRRDLVLAELKNFLEDQAYRDVPIIITSRTREDPGGGLKGLAAFEIQDLSDDAVNVFIRAYKRLEHSETEITQRLQNHRLLEPGGLGRNPFWLRLIVASGAFQGNKGQILNTAVDTLLAREWNEKPAVERSWRRVLPRDEQIEETKRALAFLGYWMSAANLVAIEHDGVLMALEKGWLAKREQAGVKGLRPQDVLGLGRDAQVLVYGSGPIRFRHRLLQEFMTAWMLMMNDELRGKELQRGATDTSWWETLFLLGGLLGSKPSLQDYSNFVLQVLGDGSNDQRLFAAIGLLRCVENPLAELSNKVTLTLAASASENLTSTQLSAARELIRILGDEAVEVFDILFHDPDQHIKTKGAALLCAIGSEHTNEILLNELRDEKKQKATTEILISLGALAVKPLIVALNDSNERVCKRAAWALGRIADSSAVEPLIAVLRNPDSRIRADAIDALGELGDSRAVKFLIATLRDTDHEIRKNAVEALGKIGDSRAVEPLVDILQNHQFTEMRFRAADALGKIGDPRAVEQLINALQDKNDTYSTVLHWNAARALGRIKDPRAVEPLIAAMQEPHIKVRILSVEALGKIGDVCAIEPLISALHDPDKQVRAYAAEALGEIGDKRAVEFLISALRDSDAYVRIHAAYALGQIGDPRAVKPLILALGNLDAWVRWPATDVLSKIENQGDLLSESYILSELYERPKQWLSSPLAFRRVGTHSSVTQLVAVLHDPDPWVRWPVVDALIRIGEPAFPSLITALRDQESQVRCHAADALGNCGNPNAIVPLIEALNDENAEVRWHVVYALGKSKDPRAVEPLIALLQDPNCNVRKHATNALRKIGDLRAIEPLINALHDKNAEMRVYVVNALGEIGDDRALFELEIHAKWDVFLTKPFIGTVAEAAQRAVEKICVRIGREVSTQRRDQNNEHESVLQLILRSRRCFLFFCELFGSKDKTINESK